MTKYIKFAFLTESNCNNSHFQLVKREPGFLGVRMWSLYARYFLRHYNELNHEFDARLKKAYLPANKYLNLFTSPMMVIIAK